MMLREVSCPQTHGLTNSWKDFHPPEYAGIAAHPLPWLGPGLVALEVGPLEAGPWEPVEPVLMPAFASMAALRSAISLRLSCIENAFAYAFKYLDEVMAAESSLTGLRSVF